MEDNAFLVSFLMFVGFIIFANIVIFIKDRIEDYEKSPKAILKATRKAPPPDLTPVLLKIDEFFSEIEEAKKKYIRKRYADELVKRFEPLYLFTIRIANSITSANPRINQFNEAYSHLSRSIGKWNEEYCAGEIATNKELFDNIDGKSLDQKQRMAVVVDEENTLVVAGAGTGKTLTVSAKVKYLVDKKNIMPDEILLMSYSRKAVEEMRERICGRLGIGVQVWTFHSFGLEIISRGLGRRPDVLDPDKKEFEKLITEYFQGTVLDYLQDMTDLIEFFAYYLNIPQDMEKYNNLGEVYEDNKCLDFETLKSKVESQVNTLKKDQWTIQGERVKSMEEVTIANYLYLHGIRYTYEKEYNYVSDDTYTKRYRPDFYLEDYDIYLEHFGINDRGRAPWLSPIEEKKYLADMVWKRNLHSFNNTVLIETYSYQNSNGQLTVSLDKLLRKHGVEYEEVDLYAIYEKVFAEKNDRYFKEFKKLLKTFIELFKSNGYEESDFDTLEKKALQEKNDFLRKRSLLFLSIVKPLYLRYQRFLFERNQIDFNDMINQATEMVRQGIVSPTYKYIVVDEYQDISVSRYKLINEIKNKSDAQVIAVGDDWQSIYRFSGSDINLFTNISKFFGYTEQVKIDKTYRNSEDLINISGKFIMKNPKQFKKQLIPDKYFPRPIYMIGYTEDHLVTVVIAINEIVKLWGVNKEILILGRTNYDVDIFDSKGRSYDIDSKYQDYFSVHRSNGEVRVKYSPYPDLRMTFLTVHRAKGLEANNVIVLNLENTLLGFPNKISDDPVLSMVLTDEDEFPYAEERRLFYVALTRTRNKVYLMVNDRNPSMFADELRRELGVPYNTVAGESSIWKNPACPRCKNGILVIRRNSTNCSQFLGCSNYPQCTYSVSDVQVNNYRKCERCGGFMVLRNGQYGNFYGCTNYPYCENSFNVTENSGDFDDDEDDIPF